MTDLRDLGDDLIGQQTIRVEALLRVLDEELDALRRRDPQRLEALSTEKQRLVTELEGLSADRGKLAMPVVDTPEAHGTDAPTRPAGAHLTKLLQKVQQNNRRNGSAIENANRYARRAVDLLFGRQNSQTLYGALGERKQLTTTRYSSIA